MNPNIPFKWTGPARQIDQGLYARLRVEYDPQDSNDVEVAEDLLTSPGSRPISTRGQVLCVSPETLPQLVEALRALLEDRRPKNLR